MVVPFVFVLYIVVMTYTGQDYSNNEGNAMKNEIQPGFHFGLPKLGENVQAASVASSKIVNCR